MPTRWSEDDVAWRVSLAGLGASSPIVRADRVFVTSQVGEAPSRPGSHPRLARDDRDLARREEPIGGRGRETGPAAGAIELVIQAFGLTDGHRLWAQRVPAAGPFPLLHEKHNLATPTPATDGERIYAWFGNGQVVALDIDGKVLWQRHLGLEYGPFQNQWGHGSSPVLYGDLLILLCDHSPLSYLVALDKLTGEERWRIDRGSGRISHSTPLVVAGPRGDELIVNSSERIDAYDPVAGHLLWHAGNPRQTPIPTPVFYDGVIYMSRGYRNSDFLAIRPGGRGDVSSSHILWRTPSGASYVPSVVHYRGLLYMTNEVGVVTCAEATNGDRLWRQRLDGVFFASPVAGDGKVYLVSETGTTFVLRAARQPEVIARNELSGRFLASPAISRGYVLLRSDDSLYGIGR